MATRQQMNGMLGVYLTAAELTSRGFIVSPTSRNAFGADLLVTDQKCRRAWSVQVKTKSGRQKYWHLNKAAIDLSSKSHVYVFVTLNSTNRPDYLVIGSNKVVVSINKYKSKNYLWHTFKEPAKKSKIEGWKIFGSPEYIG
jgi:hypothetical protein